MQEAKINKWYFFILAFIIEFSAVFMASKGFNFLKNNIIFIHALSYILLFIGIYFNRTIFAFKIIFLGVFLNFLVIMANGGQMPVAADTMIRIGLTDNLLAIQNGKIVTHTIIGGHTALSFLGDIFAFGKPYPRPKIFSIGDVIMAVGVFIYIQKIMTKKAVKIKYLTDKGSLL
ncbi:MAG: DUF5317 domain-containing protein [Caulobacteraceae bacterium]